MATITKKQSEFIEQTIRMRQKELNNDTQEYLINDESDENELKTEQYNASTSVTESNQNMCSICP